MPTTSPARIDDDLYASAKLAGDSQSRSTSQQVVHWARIGREIEASSEISLRDIAEVLAGSRPYDGLNAREQALVRAEWSERMDDLRTALDFAAEFSSAGRGWVELDDDGAVVERTPSPSSVGSIDKQAMERAKKQRRPPSQVSSPAARTRKPKDSINVVSEPLTTKRSVASGKGSAKQAEASTKPRKKASPKALSRPGR